MRGYLLMQDGAEHSVGEDWPAIECFRCGVCCVRYRPKVTKLEMKRIARKLGISTAEFFSKYVRVVPTKDGYILQSSVDGCLFLHNEEKGIRAACSIHSVRPKACRDWVPSLSRPECKEGLGRLKVGGGLLLPDEVYHSKKETKRLYSALQDSRCPDGIG